MPRHNASLTEKQRRFVEAYMGQAAGNGHLASKLAGYKGNANTLKAVASNLLRQQNIREAMGQRTAECPLVATRQERQEFWTKVMQGKETQVVKVLEDGTPVEMSPEMKDRLKASELLGRSQGDFIEKVELTGKDGGPLEIAPAYDFSKLSLDELRSLKALTAKAKQE
jgi:phage terminase small subunit